VDPETHGVMDELKRIQKYNGKILAAVDCKSSTSGADSNAPDSSNRINVDKDAASRFIKAAISTRPPQASATDSPAKPDLIHDGPGPHSRLKSLAVANTRDNRSVNYEEGESNSEDDLQIQEGDLATKDEHAVTANNSSDLEDTGNVSKPQKTSEKKEDKEKRKRDEEIATSNVNPAPSSKHKIQDPLAGYDDATKPRKTKANQTDSNRAISIADEAIGSKQKKTKKKRRTK